jgi:hypothetical protein
MSVSITVVFLFFLLCSFLLEFCCYYFLGCGWWTWFDLSGMILVFRAGARLPYPSRFYHLTAASFLDPYFSLPYSFRPAYPFLCALRVTLCCALMTNTTITKWLSVLDVVIRRRHVISSHVLRSLPRFHLIKLICFSGFCL